MIRSIASLLLFCTAFVVAPLATSAAPVTVPTELPVGASYRLAFLTSASVTIGSSSDVAFYNDVVTDVAAGVAELAALGTTWTAIVSTATVDARDNTGTNPSSSGVPIYRLDDTRIADNNSDLWDGTIAAPLSTYESGVSLPPNSGMSVLTGTIPSGIRYDSGFLGDYGEHFIGLSYTTDHRWISVGYSFTPGVDNVYPPSTRFPQS